MRSFADYNPRAVTLYFLAVVGISMFSMDPVILTLSLVGALLLFLMRNGLRGGRSHLYTLGLFAVMTLINPLVSHNGATVLFVMNHNPVTLEALIYGAAASVMIVAVLYWFRSFSQIMTSDKLLYLFGSVWPRLSLMLSMALRYVPLFGLQAKKIEQSQRALGLYKEENIIDRFRGGMRIFSVMVTWALENGIVTADSMTARGYGLDRRSQFSLFRVTAGDVFLMAASVLLAGLTFTGLSGMEFRYYPTIRASALTPAGLVGYLAYGVLILLPTLMEVREEIRWKYLKSKI